MLSGWLPNIAAGERKAQFTSRRSRQTVQQLAGAFCAGVDVLRKFGCVDQLHAGCDIQAARAADNQKIGHGGGFGRFVNAVCAAREIGRQIRVVPARVERADDGIEAFELFGEIRRVHIRRAGGNVWGLEHFVGVAGESRYFVAACGEFLYGCVADQARLRR